MKTKLLSLLAAISCLASVASAQCVDPIIVPANPQCGPETYYTNQDAFTYMWSFSTTGFFSVDPPPPAPLPVALMPPLTHSVPAMGCFVQETAGNTGASHYFINEYAGNLYRYDYAPGGFPVSTTPNPGVNLGNFGSLGGEAEGIDIVQDGTSGLWYGLMVNNTDLIQISFGPLGLTNPTPAFTRLSLPGLLYWPHQLTIKHYPDPGGSGNDWHAFIGNRNNSLLRLDFPGTTAAGLMAPPLATSTAIPNVGGVANPCNFTLYQDKNTCLWYALVTSLINATISRYDFGPNLLNNTPAGTLYTPSPPSYYLCRGIHIFPDCDNHLVAFEFNEDGGINMLDYPNGDILATPVTSVYLPSGSSPIGTTGTPCTALTNNIFTFIEPDFGNGGTYYFPGPAFFYVPTATAFSDYLTGYQNFTAGVGPYQISLMYDMGRESGPSVACAEVSPQCNPCYNPQSSMFITQSTVDPCSFTACTNVGTTNTITGYTWDVEPGSYIFTDPTSSGSDCITFLMTPGIVYTVTVTAHIVDANLNCCQAVFTQTVTCGGLNPINPGPGSGEPNGVVKSGAGSDIQIYPNPTNNVVSVASATVVINSIQVFDVKGQKLKDFSFDGTKSTSISLDKLPAGSYVIRVNNSISTLVNKTE